MLGMVARNVAALVDPPKQDGHRTEDTMSKDEVAKVLAQAAGDKDRGALAVVLLTLGLRQGEALALRWSDVDLDAGELTVRHTIKFPVGGGYELTAPKTEESARTIPLPKRTVAALRKHRTAQTTKRIKSRVWRDLDFVFATPLGTPFHSRNALRWWHTLLDDAGVGKRRMHASRHTTATLLLEDGVPLEVVSAVLGHSSLAITADIYAKVGRDSMRRALATFDDMTDAQ